MTALIQYAAIAFATLYAIWLVRALVLQTIKTSYAGQMMTGADAVKIALAPLGKLLAPVERLIGRQIERVAKADAAKK